MALRFIHLLTSSFNQYVLNAYYGAKNSAGLVAIFYVQVVHYLLSDSEQERGNL